jgi:hypothetical protein
MIIYENSDSPHINIDDAIFFLVNNCQDYHFCNDTNRKWTLDTYENSKDYENVYLLIDTHHNEAFAHWIYESFVYLRFYHRIKQIYPSIKIVFKSKRIFKILFCKYLNISEEEMVYSIPNDKPNLCVIPQPITALNYKICNGKNIKLINNLFNHFKNETLIDNSHYLIMPRQSKESYYGNDSIMELLSVIKYFNNNKISNYVLHTDEITDINDQINILSRYKNIILVDGSALLVNGMLCRNKNLYVVGRLCTQYQSERYVKFAYLLKCIQEINNNNIFYYNTESEFCNFMETK